MIQMKMVKKVAVTLMFFVFTLSVTAQESVLLRYNYKKGDKYQMTMVMKQNMGIMGGMNISMNSEVNVLSNGDNKFELSTQAKRVQMNMAQGGQEVNFDSEDKEEDLDAEGKKMKAQFDEVLKTTAYHTFSDQGKLISMKTVPEIPNNIANNKDVIGYTIFPKEAVKVGSTWKQDLSLEGMKLGLTYKVKEITKTHVIADVSGNLELMGVKASLTGFSNFNRESGNTDEMNLNSSIEMQGMKITMTANVKIAKQ